MAKSPTTAAKVEEPVAVDTVAVDTAQAAPVQEEPAPEAAPASAPVLPVLEEEPRIAVAEFCTRALDLDRNAYAGLYAFQRREEKAGRVLDTPTAYSKRFREMMTSHPKS